MSSEGVHDTFALLLRNHEHEHEHPHGPGEKQALLSAAAARAIPALECAAPGTVSSAHPKGVPEAAANACAAAKKF